MTNCTQQRLFEILTQAREHATRFYETKTRESPDAVDLDAYSHIRISRRKRTLWRILQDFAARTVDPEFGTIAIKLTYPQPWAWDNPAADKIIAEFLCSKGIPAEQTTRYR